MMSAAAVVSRVSLVTIATICFGRVLVDNGLCAEGSGRGVNTLLDLQTKFWCVLSSPTCSFLMRWVAGMFMRG